MHDPGFRGIPSGVGAQRRVPRRQARASATPSAPGKPSRDANGGDVQHCTTGINDIVRKKSARLDFQREFRQAARVAGLVTVAVSAICAKSCDHACLPSSRRCPHDPASRRRSRAVRKASCFLRKRFSAESWARDPMASTVYVERQVKPRRADDATRITLVALSWLIDWRRVLTVVKPDTLIRWHRRGFQLFGRPRLPEDHATPDLGDGVGESNVGRDADWVTATFRVYSTYSSCWKSAHVESATG
jgi:hypothetical protein